MERRDSCDPIERGKFKLAANLHKTAPPKWGGGARSLRFSRPNAIPVKMVRFFSRTVVFGAVADVLHYNVFSRTLDEMVNSYLDVPLLSFFRRFRGSYAQMLNAPRSSDIYAILLLTGD